MNDDNRCRNPVAFERYWPGQPRDYVCKEHGAASVDVLADLGCFVELRPIDAPGEHCACRPGLPGRVVMR